MTETIQFQEQVDNKHFDAVIIGSGPAGIYTLHQLQKRVGSNFTTLVLEQHPETLGGSAHASLQQYRLFQGEKPYAEAVASTVKAYREASTQMDLPEGAGLVHPFPYLFVARDAEQLAGFTKQLKQVQQWGYEPDGEILTPEELHHRYPFIDREVTGALVCPDSGSLDFASFMQHILRRAQNTKVSLGTPAGEILVENKQVTGLKTPDGTVHTERIIMATGPFIVQLGEQLENVDLPPEATKELTDFFIPKKRQRFSAPIKETPPQTDLFAIAPRGSYCRIHTDSTGEGSGDYGYANPQDPPVHKPQVHPEPEAETDFMLEVYSGLAKIGSNWVLEEEKWTLLPDSMHAGYYTNTRDGLPVAGKAFPQIEGLFLVNGGGHGGVMSGCAPAEFTAKEAFEEPTDPNPFRPHRDLSAKESKDIVL